MSIAPGTRPITWEDALELPNGERYEVIDGELKERRMSFGSSAIAMLISKFLWRWLDTGHPGFVTGSDGGYTIFPWAPGDVRMPDVSYISKARLPRVPARGWVSVAPELAVEVVSPNDRFIDVESKARDWILAGVDLVWVVVPATESVQVWRKNGERAILRSGEMLSGEDVLPGFEVAVADLFREVAEEID